MSASICSPPWNSNSWWGKLRFYASCEFFPLNCMFWIFDSELPSSRLAATCPISNFATSFIKHPPTTHHCLILPGTKVRNSRRRPSSCCCCAADICVPETINLKEQGYFKCKSVAWYVLREAILKNAQRDDYDRAKRHHDRFQRAWQQLATRINFWVTIFIDLRWLDTLESYWNLTAQCKVWVELPWGQS